MRDPCLLLPFTALSTEIIVVSGQGFEGSPFHKIENILKWSPVDFKPLALLNHKLIITITI